MGYLLAWIFCFPSKNSREVSQGAKVGSNLRHSHGSKDIPQSNQGFFNGTPGHQNTDPW